MNATPPPQSQTSRPRKRNPQETKGRLLEAAQRVFTDKGFDAARVDEIARLAGVNKRMIYEYFGNKESLYETVLHDNFQSAFETSHAALATETDNPREQLASVIRGYFRMLADTPDLVRLFVWASLNYGRWPALFEDMFVRGLQEVVATIERGVQEGVFRKEIDARNLVFVVSGLCLQYFSRRPMVQALWGEDITASGEQARVLEGMIDLVFRGILSDTHHASAEPNGETRT